MPFIPPSLAIKEKKAEKQRIGESRVLSTPLSSAAAAPNAIAGGLEDPKAVAKRSRVSVDEFQYR